MLQGQLSLTTNTHRSQTINKTTSRGNKERPARSMPRTSGARSIAAGDMYGLLNGLEEVGLSEDDRIRLLEALDHDRFSEIERRGMGPSVGTWLAKLTANPPDGVEPRSAAKAVLNFFGI